METDDIYVSMTGIVSAPLWDSKTSTFAGLLTTSDYINVIQYYWQNPGAMKSIDQFRLDSLRGKAPHSPFFISNQPSNFALFNNSSKHPPSTKYPPT